MLQKKRIIALRPCLERMKSQWISHVYAFFTEPVVNVDLDGRIAHVFRCQGRNCSHVVRRYQDTKDRVSTGNMFKHVKACWGHEVLDAAKGAGTIKDARKKVMEPYKRSGQLTASFKLKGEGKPTYSTMPLDRIQTKYVEMYRWYNHLMKTGRPEQYVPSPSTVSRDVKRVFAHSRIRLAKMLRDLPGKISFEADGWTSPNHKAFIGITARFEQDGVLVQVILDIVELPKSHTGFNMAEAF
ncbi:hypothetical protein BDN72DRAFT_791600, partial [Pluteus cervinus]